MIRGLVAAAILASAIVTTGAAGADSPAPIARAAWMRTPCATEDSVDCYWRAPRASGHSFYARQLPGTSRVCHFYIGRRYARHHDRCEVTR